MPRSQVVDYLQTGRFHVLDVSLSLPPVLLPVFAFKSCTLPSMEVEIVSHKEANYEFPRKYIKGASVGTTTLEQGVSMFNSDFYDWTIKAIKGFAAPKTLMIMQYTRITGGSNISSIAGLPVPSAVAGGFNKYTMNLFTDAVGPARIPGKAWILKEARPKSYVPGQALDGSSMEVSLASLEIECEEFEELSFGI